MNFKVWNSYTVCYGTMVPEGNLRVDLLAAQSRQAKQGHYDVVELFLGDSLTDWSQTAPDWSHQLSYALQEAVNNCDTELIDLLFYLEGPAREISASAYLPKDRLPDGPYRLISYHQPPKRCFKPTFNGLSGRAIFPQVASVGSP
jgi:hypothetical protein